MIKDKSDYITSLEAAAILGFTPEYIRKLISNGKIRATKLGHNWIIKRKELRKIERQRWPKTLKGSEDGTN